MKNSHRITEILIQKFYMRYQGTILKELFLVSLS